MINKLDIVWVIETNVYVDYISNINGAYPSTICSATTWNNVKFMFIKIVIAFN